MKIISEVGREDLAIVYMAQTSIGEYVEFVESLQPPHSREQKWILIVSTLYGCPVSCKMCDAGLFYHGRVSKDAIFAQIDYMVTKRYPDRKIPVKQLKIQFARTGEPSFNLNVIDAIEEFDYYFETQHFVPSVSTIAPNGTDKFFEELLRIKNEKFRYSDFQLQFSIHTTDEYRRDELIPVKKWSFQKISRYGENFYKQGDRKVALNFAVSKEYPVIPSKLLEYFNPEIFIIKVTPLNPTYNSRISGLTSFIGDNREYEPLREEFESCGYETIISLGEFEENYLGSNCGQSILKHISEDEWHETGYTHVKKDTRRII
jgi:23S rRNA (adenine2503-C2)-methyltransferase